MRDRIFLPARWETLIRGLGLLGGVILLAGMAGAAPAAAQQNPMAGRWSCSQAVHNTRNNFRSLSQFTLLLYPNGSFRAQGNIRGGMAVTRFAAQGNWRVWKERGVWWFNARGGMVSQSSTGYRSRSTHVTFGRVYNTRFIGWRNLAPGGMQITLACRR